MATQAFAGSLTGPIIDVGLRVEIEDVVQLPATASSPPLSRVNFLHEAPDNSGRLFANELRGPLYVIRAGIIETYLDLSSEVPLKTVPNIGTGFVSFTFHPEFASNGLFYTVHTEVVGSEPANLGPAIPAEIDQHSVLTEWKAADPTSDFFSGTRRELIRVAAISTNHNMGEIAFNSSARRGNRDYGNLYIGAGDYGSIAMDQADQLQRIDSPYGAILRIDPLGEPFERNGLHYPYGIPADNPFAKNPGALAEVFAYGFRNAHRLSWNKGGKMFVSDIGQSHIEEVNIVKAGQNFGWPDREGTFALDVETDAGTVLPLPDTDALPYRYPVAQYDHDEGRAIAGGFYYRGKEIPELKDHFVFGDIANGRIFYADAREMFDANNDDSIATAQIYELHLRRDQSPTSLIALVRLSTGRSVFRTDLRLAMDNRGELYVTTKQDGFVRRLKRDSRPDCSDDFDDDGDGLTDYPDDPGCFNAMSAEEDPQCQDGINNDGRRGTDFDGGASVLGTDRVDPRGADPQCDGKPWLDREAKRGHPRREHKKSKPKR